MGKTQDIEKQIAREVYQISQKNTKYNVKTMLSNVGSSLVDKKGENVIDMSGNDESMVMRYEYQLDKDSAYHLGENIARIE